jgi:hypothetical protein
VCARRDVIVGTPTGVRKYGSVQRGRLSCRDDSTGTYGCARCALTRLVDRREETLGRDRLLQYLGDVEGGDIHLAELEARDQDDRYVPRTTDASHGSKYFAATHARHQEIEQHDGGHLGGRVEHLDDLGSVAGRVHLVAVPGLIVGLLGLVIPRRAPIAECPEVAEDYGRTRSADRNAA